MSEHLQPESINAFVEGVLPEHERVECLAHFAECSRCRDIAFVAQQTSVEKVVLDQPVASVPAWRRWFAPIAGLSAAAAAVAALLVWLGVHHHPTPAVASATQPQLTAVLKPQPQMMPAPEPKTHPALRAHIAGKRIMVAKDATAASAVAIIADQTVKLPSAIAGTVVDPAGAAITRAAVTLSSATGTPTSNTQTDANGQFLVSGLVPGPYTLQVTAPGFSRASKQIEVHPNEVAKVESVLSVGSMSQSIEVSAASSVLSTQMATQVRPLKPRADTLTSAPAATKDLTLPSKLPSVTTVRKDKVMLAADSAGTLFLTKNSGKSWKTVKPQWTGKVTRLSAANAVFELTTDPASAWLSRDGIHWHPRPAPREK